MFPERGRKACPHLSGKTNLKLLLVLIITMLTSLILLLACTRFTWYLFGVITTNVCGLSRGAGGQDKAGFLGVCLPCG